DAFQKLSQQGMPSNRDDHWKYSGLHTEVLKNFQSPVINTHENIIKQFENLPLFSKDRSQMVLLYNGQLIHKTKQSAFQFRMLNELQGQIPVNLQPFFEPSWLESYSSMSLFNQSFAKDGLYLHIPDHTELTAPIYVFHLSESDKMPCMTHPQNYIFVGEHSKVQLVEIYISQGSAKILQNALTHIQIAANASLDHIIYQQSEA